MEMESTRRSSFDRSREQLGLKKPRLAEQQQQPNPNGRPFTQRPAPAGAVTAASASARFRVGSDRETESNDSRYQPQLQPYQELVSQYKTALAELTFNSKPIITNLTIIAGENLRAAKAIASTICANIIEVPSEQKLPSLYLLDSIVKNIGGDYIKNFAARLPEVFCKAYRQVDPSVHSSMRHLFGTWKGVFPPQALQMIEKELGFAPALNGSSSGAATSRPESQSQRPAHSIHVNPKYLERQRIQQSSRVKGMTNDLTVPTANSTGDVERPDRAVNIGAGRPWVDPPIKMPNLQSSQREALREPAQEKKKVGATFGDFEYGSGVARNPALGIGRSGGRVAEPGHGAGSNVQETLSVQRNGLSMNRGFPSLPASKSSAVEFHLQPTQKIARRSGSVMSTSWKNSEEEEYMWEMHSRLSDQGAANLSNNSRKDQWTPDDSDKLDLERFDGETSSDSLSTEQKEHAAFRHRSSSPWQLQESHLTDGLACSETTISTDHLEGYPASLSGVATSANPSLGRLAARMHMGSSHIGNPGLALSAKTASMSTETLGKQRFQSIGAASPSELSPMRQHMSSPSIQTHYPHLQNSAEQDYGQSQSLTRPDYRAQLSGNLLPSNVHRGNLPRLQPLDSQASSVPAFPLSSRRLVSQPRQPDSKESEASGQIQKACPPPVSDFGTQSISGTSASDHLNPITAATSGQSSTASLLAEVMKSGILSNINTGVVPDQNFQDTVKMQTQLSTQPPLPSGARSQFSSSGSRITSASSIARRSHANSSSTVTNLSHRKEEQPPLPPGPPSSSAQTPDKASDPISNLLSTLVAKGLISSSNSETPSRKLPTESKNENASIMSSSSKTISPTILHLSAVDEACCLEPDAKSSDALPQSIEGKIKSTEGKINILIGLEFKSDVIRELHPPVISALYDDLPHHCSICGLKLKLEEQLDRHLELHNRKKAELDGTSRETRRWYSELGNWVSGKEGLQLEGESSGLMDEFEVAMEPGEQMVLAHEDQCVCVLCGNLFEDYYSQERNKWMFKGAVHMTPPSGDGEVGTSKENAKGPIVHASCISESSLYDLGLTNGI